ncbi:MAG: hypothetical protein KAH32_04680 [Chlamydiia bacterium]|nr:hypothetical protein [Chlamydiia bacterium]
MTVREFYRNILIELNKEEASALYVEDFLYYVNKATNWYTNTRYSKYDTSQQLGDDLKDLREGPEELTIVEGFEDNKVCKLSELKKSYRHLLNCIVYIQLHGKSIIECEQKPNTIQKYPAKRLTSDRKAALLNNAFLEPKFYRPYYDIIGDDLEIVTGSGTTYEINKVTIEYLKNPAKIEMKAEDLLSLEDNTEELEFSDYVITEILNQTLVFVLEQAGDPRVSVHPAVNQSIQEFGGK